ncbi:hypothetical protein [Terriglobus sp.]|uniref:hypothetical protein n=1 Tax=Terriglobus sp. TaxID=1889013 RepID=UPI003B00BB69
MSAPENATGAAGARAAATAATAALGRATALVRLPSPPLAATLEEELGLPSPEFHDIALTPCVVRQRSNGSRELLVSAATLEAALGVGDADAAKLTLQGAAFVQVGGDALLLRELQALQVHGRAYLYRLFLREANAEVRA